MRKSPSICNTVRLEPGPYDKHLSAATAQHAARDMLRQVNAWAPPKNFAIVETPPAAGFGALHEDDPLQHWVTGLQAAPFRRSINPFLQLRLHPEQRGFEVVTYAWQHRVRMLFCAQDDTTCSR